MTVAEYFNKHKNLTGSQIEARKLAIRNELRTNHDANLEEIERELAALEEVVAHQAEKRGTSKAFNPLQNIGAENRDDNVYSTQEYRRAFFKNLKGLDLTDEERSVFNQGKAELRASTFGAASNMAAVIPTQTLNQILVKARAQLGVIGISRSFGIPSNLSVPVATPSGLTQFGGHSEGTAVDSDTPSIANVLFKPNETVKIFSLSRNAEATSIDALESYLIDELTAVMMNSLDNALINGAGGTAGAGLASIAWSAANSATYANGGVPKFTDLTGIASLLKAGYGANAKWVMSNQTLFSMVWGMTNTVSGQPIFVNNPQTEGIGYLLGRPVILDDYAGFGNFFFGSFDFLAYNLPLSITIEKSLESSFKQNLIDYKAVMIGDVQVIIADAFVKLSQAAA
ncbi:phage major capsid protein [Anaeroselena agilis]|uniref:Phage major capsid protein n=1 Tax=Anaeroselena agilis TaxID=3063788 RepID=A0ABU3P2H2_9FIRM|nr:phage major capsid protein [Selenomonadales bacterium 4137-cl]